MCKYCCDNPEPILDDRYLRVIVRKTSQSMKLVMQIREKKKEIGIDIENCPKCGEGHVLGARDEFIVDLKKEKIYEAFFQRILP